MQHIKYNDVPARTQTDMCTASSFNLIEAVVGRDLRTENYGVLTWTHTRQGLQEEYQ